MKRNELCNYVNHDFTYNLYLIEELFFPFLFLKHAHCLDLRKLYYQIHVVDEATIFKAASCDPLVGGNAVDIVDHHQTFFLVSQNEMK